MLSVVCCDYFNSAGRPSSIIESYWLNSFGKVKHTLIYTPLFLPNNLGLGNWFKIDRLSSEHQLWIEWFQCTGYGGPNPLLWEVKSTPAPLFIPSFFKIFMPNFVVLDWTVRVGEWMSLQKFWFRGPRLSLVVGVGVLDTWNSLHMLCQIWYVYGWRTKISGVKNFCIQGPDHLGWGGMTMGLPSPLSVWLLQAC